MDKRTQLSLWIVILTIWAVWSVLRYKSSGCGTFESFQDALNSSQCHSTNHVDSKTEFDNSHILSFIQISDLHLSKFSGNAIANFKHFLDNELPLIDPNFVIVTGDLTDALSENGLHSGQNEEEWKMYKTMLEEKGIFDRKDFWFDLRGNHDCFGVDSSELSDNHFLRYSVQKKTSYTQHITMPFGVVSVVAIDGSPMYGPARPFNFFGSMSTAKMDEFEAHITEAMKNKAQHIFLIGHYPTVTMQFQRTSSGKSFAELSKNISAYFSGHLHELLFGLGKIIRSYQPTGFADLEVADLKEHGMYRLIILDNKITSFSDHKLGDYPIIHISNPKDSRYLIPNHEPVDLIAKSSLLRVSIFSPIPISSVTVIIDKRFHFDAKQSNEVEGLWTSSWNPSQFADSIVHTISVQARDFTGNQKGREEKFIIPPRTIPFYSLGEFLLNLNFPRLIQNLFIFLFLLTFSLVLLFICLVKYSKFEPWMQVIHERIYYQRQQEGHGGVFMRFHVFWRQLQFYSLSFGNNLALVLPVLLVLFYMTIGPWFIGHLVTDSDSPASVYLYGIKHRSNWVILLDTWFYALIHLVSFIIPSIFVLALYSSDRNISSDPESTDPAIADNDDQDSTTLNEDQSIDENLHPSLPFQHSLIFRSIIICWWLLNLIRIIRIKLNYGWMSFLLSPCYTWYFIWSSGSILYYGHRSLRHHSRTCLKYS